MNPYSASGDPARKWRLSALSSLSAPNAKDNFFSRVATPESGEPFHGQTTHTVSDQTTCRIGSVAAPGWMQPLRHSTSHVVGRELPPAGPSEELSSRIISTQVGLFAPDDIAPQLILRACRCTNHAAPGSRPQQGSASAWPLPDKPSIFGPLGDLATLKRRKHASYSAPWRKLARRAKSVCGPGCAPRAVHSSAVRCEHGALRAWCGACT
jgi:hypothetical protein